MENLSNMCICLHGSGARRPPYTHYLGTDLGTVLICGSNNSHKSFATSVYLESAFTVSS